MLEKWIESFRESALKSSDNIGISVSPWFSKAKGMFATPGESPIDESAGDIDPPKPLEPVAPIAIADPDELIRDLLNKTPDISAASFYNWIKSQGFTFSKAQTPTTTPDAAAEADSATSQAVGILAESEAKEGSFRFFESMQMVEGAPSRDSGAGPTRFRVALIQEGLGNFRDAFYYTREALVSAAAVFEGKKCFADHPGRVDAENRPERSVRDVVGHFEKVHTEENKDGTTRLCADLVVLPDHSYDWARSLVLHSVAYSKQFPDKEFIGLSINASGDAEPVSIDDLSKQVDIPEGAKSKLQTAIAEGVTTVRVVSNITDAVSCDLVTEPGAKGRVIEILEGENP